MQQYAVQNMQEICTNMQVRHMQYKQQYAKIC